MQSPARSLKFCDAQARVAYSSHLHGRELEQELLFWSLPYIREKNIPI